AVEVALGRVLHDDVGALVVGGGVVYLADVRMGEPAREQRFLEEERAEHLALVAAQQRRVVELDRHLARREELAPEIDRGRLPAAEHAHHLVVAELHRCRDGPGIEMRERADAHSRSSRTRPRSRSTSRRRRLSSPRVPMPLIAVAMARSPRSGAGRISPSASPITSETLDTASPTRRPATLSTMALPSSSRSASGNPNMRPRSTIGTISPRRLITPRT